MHPTSVSSVEDMIKLGDLQEYAILKNLHTRYIRNFVYVIIINKNKIIFFPKLNKIKITFIFLDLHW